MQPDLELLKRNPKYSGDRWEAIVYSDSHDIAAKNALQFLNHALAHGNDLAALLKAEEMMVAHVARGRGLKAFHYRNLGIVLNSMLQHAEHNTASVRARTKEAFRTYLALADAAGEPVQERAAIEQVIDMMVQFEQE